MNNRDHEKQNINFFIIYILKSNSKINIVNSNIFLFYYFEWLRLLKSKHQVFHIFHISNDINFLISLIQKHFNIKIHLILNISISWI